MKIVMFDCDSTLVRSEGIDDLADAQGVGSEIRELTNAAMGGAVSFSEIFAKRLDKIRPRQQDLQFVTRRYLDNIVEDAEQVINVLKYLGYEVGIISGGYSEAVLALATFLGIGSEYVYAVELKYAQDGQYLGYEDPHGLARSGGKVRVLNQLRAQHTPKKLVMIGDGATDLESVSVVDLFIGYGGVATREGVAASSPVYIDSPSLAPVLEVLLSVEERQQANAFASDVINKATLLKEQGAIRIR